MADLLVENATIHTLDPERPLARQMAVKAGRIMSIGEDVSAHVGPETKRLDARGGTVVPGFVDGHGHMAGLGQSLETVDLRDTATAQEAVRRVAEAVKITPKDSWILGRGWDQTRWPGAEFPGSEALSETTPNNPVLLTRVDGHAAWVNRRALDAAGIGPGTPDPPGGKIHRDASGSPTGILIDRAIGLVSRQVPPPEREHLRSRLIRAAQECARLGITTVHDAGVSQTELDLYRELIQRNQLPVRVYAMIRGEGQVWDQYLRRGPEIGPRLTVRSIKLVADGALGSRGAALKDPYADEPGNRGLLILSRDDIERVARAAVERGFQVNTHAIGDLANRTVLDAYGAVLGGKNDRRFRVEHAQIVSPEDMPDFARFSVLASMQATHATSDMRWAERRLGPKRLAGAYRWRRFLDLGVPVVNGSDFPVEDPNPLWGFYAAITRRDHKGWPEGGWLPDQILTRHEALRSWTLAGAYAAFEEKDKGSLTSGKLADFVVLSRDITRIPAAEILTTHVTTTVLGGEILYRNLYKGTVEFSGGQSRYLAIGGLERPATLISQISILQGKGGLRAILTRASDLSGPQKQEGGRWLRSAEFSGDGELRHHIQRPGEYALVLDNRFDRGQRVSVNLDIGVYYDEQSSFEPRTLPPARRALIVVLSLSLFAMIGGWSGWKVIQAFRSRPAHTGGRVTEPGGWLP